MQRAVTFDISLADGVTATVADAIQCQLWQAMCGGAEALTCEDRFDGFGDLFLFYLQGYTLCI